MLINEATGDALFDRTAKEFATAIDTSIATNTYFRGKLFLTMTQRELPLGSRILDYGCGPGRIARIIAEHGYEVEAVDPSPMMIREAEDQHTRGLPLTFGVTSGTGDELQEAA